MFTPLTSERKPWSFAASITLQIGFTATVLLYSLTQDERPGLVRFREMLPVLAPQPIELVPVPMVNSSGAVLQGPATTQPTRTFTAPARVPRGIASIVEDIGTPSALYSSGAGFVTGVLTSLIGEPGTQRVAAPPVVVKPELPKLVRVGGQVLEAQIIRRVLPIYPQLAKQARISGRVELAGSIGKDGKVANLQVVSGHPMLVLAALEAVRQWTYRPTFLNGEPTEVSAPIVVQFSLTQ